MSRPICFVLMPFGRKPDGKGGVVDFDAVYRAVIAPAIDEAGLDPLRADEEMAGGFIHKPMYERLIFCDYAVADLTTANANVFYELGIRHALRPFSTVLLFAANSRLPFDVAPLRGLPYSISPSGVPASVETDRSQIADWLKECRSGTTDSPLFQLVEGMPIPDIKRLKTDVFRQQVEYSTQKKAELAAARKQGVTALRAIETNLGPVADVEAGVVVDLFLSYRAVKAWPDMIELVEKMAPPLAATVMVREQLGLALNRAGRDDEAELVLRDLLEQRGPSSETYGILGRVYKDRWERAHAGGETALAQGLLEKAIDAYLRGFEADWRDAYPGVNAVTLMEVREPADPRKEALLPVVAYAVDRRIKTGEPDYWDFASRLGLAVLKRDEAEARAALASSLASIREAFEPETTARNLRLIREAREQQGHSVLWANECEQELVGRAQSMNTPKT